jgi:hypothetical protein
MRIILAGAMLLVMGAVTDASAAPVQWAGNGHYYEYVPTRLNWAGALADSNSRTYLSLSGYLATVSSAAENTFVSSLLVDAEWGAWLAGSDAAVEGEWRWVAGPELGQQFWQGDQHGAPVAGAYNGWGNNEPNNLNNENALAVWGPNGANGATSWGQWNDFQGSDTQGYVVEYSAVPEPSTLLLSVFGGIAFTVWRYRGSQQPST